MTWERHEDGGGTSSAPLSLQLTAPPSSPVDAPTGRCTSFHHPWLVASTEHSHFQGPYSASPPTFPRNLGQGPQWLYQKPFEKCTHWPVSNLNSAPTRGLRDLTFSISSWSPNLQGYQVVTSSWTWGHSGNFPFCLKVSVPVQTQQIPCSIISERWFPD